MNVYNNDGIRKYLINKIKEEFLYVVFHNIEPDGPDSKIPSINRRDEFDNDSLVYRKLVDNEANLTPLIKRNTAGSLELEVITLNNIDYYVSDDTNAQTELVNAFLIELTLPDNLKESSDPGVALKYNSISLIIYGENSSVATGTSKFANTANISVITQSAIPRTSMPVTAGERIKVVIQF